MNRIFPTAVLLALALLPNVRAAEEAPPASDLDFLTRALISGHREVKLSELAKTRAESDKVKEFAQLMVEDHKLLSEKLTKAADRKIAIGVGLEKETKEAHEKLSKLTGAEFDRAYTRHMVEDHEKAIKLFEAFSKSDKGNEEMRKCASEALPKLREHLQMARKLAGPAREDRSR